MLYEISADLKTAEATLDHWYKNFPKIARTAMEARLAYDLAYADAIRAIAERVPEEGKKHPTVPQADAEATQMVFAQMKRAREAEAELEIAKRLISLADSSLSSIQTRSKIDLAEISLK